MFLTRTVRPEKEKKEKSKDKSTMLRQPEKPKILDLDR
jgi:hypothetical protein